MNKTAALIACLKADLAKAERNGDTPSVESLLRNIDRVERGEPSYRTYTASHLCYAVQRFDLQDWVIRCENEHRKAPRCVYISDDGKWTHLHPEICLEREVIYLKNKHATFELLIAEENKTWCSGYSNMELQFLYVG